MKFTVTVTPLDEPLTLPDFNETWKQVALKLATEKTEPEVESQEAASPPAKPHTVGETLAAAESGSETAADQTSDVWYGSLLRIFDIDQVEDAYRARQDSVGMTERNRLASAMTALRSNGDHRRLATIPLEWRTSLNNLEKLFPNFSEVIEYLRSAFALSVHMLEVPELAPMLLNGPPGVGKTLFASHFARLFGSGFVKIGMETAQSAARVSGSAEYWANTKPGIVYETLVKERYANPVFFLDEIDKARDDTNDPLMSLYSLFERHTAAHFCDESYPWVTLDASHIMWICTSNSVEDLPEPILSRLRRFDIPQPDDRQTRHIALQVFKDVLSGLPPYLQKMRLKPSALNCLCGMSPRLIQMAVREGIGRAVYHNRSTVWPKDLPMVGEDVVEPRRIGFLP